MTVYNINLGIGWASSGVEYAQAYRAKRIRDKIPQVRHHHDEGTNKVRPGEDLHESYKELSELNARRVRHSFNVRFLSALQRSRPGCCTIHQLLNLAEVLQQVLTLLHLLLRNR